MQPENIQNVQNVLDVLDILDVLNVLNVSAVTLVQAGTELEFKTQQPKGKNFIKLLKDSLSVGGNPKMCPKPCPSVFYSVNPIETFGSQIV